MAKLLKLIAGLIGLLIVLVAVGAVLAPRIVSPNDFKDEITARVEAATGRQLTIAGDIGLSVFPWLGLELNQASLASPPGFGGEPFARVDRMKIRARLLPLLERRLEVDQVELDGLRLHLVRDAEGRANWEAPPAAGPSAGQSAGPTRPVNQTRPSASPDVDLAPAVAGLAVAGAKVTDARVDWEDRQSGQRITIDKLELTSGTIAPGRPVSLKLSGRVLDAGSEPVAHFAGKGTAVIDGNLRWLTVEPLQMDIRDIRTTDGLAAEAQLAGRLKADLPTRRYTLDPLTIAMQLGGSALSGGQVAAKVGGRLALDLEAETATVQDLTISSGALQINGDGHGQAILSAPILHGRLSVAELNLRDWLQAHRLPLPQTADPKALTRFALTTGWRLADGRVALSDLALRLDQSQVKGTAEVVPDEPPAYRFDLSADALNLDRYLPPQGARSPVSAAQVAKGTAPGAPPGPAPKTQETGHQTAELPQPAPSATEPASPVAGPAAPIAQVLIPVALVRDLDLDGTLRAGELRLGGLAFGDPLFKIKAKDGNVSLEDQVPRFYGGRLNGRFGLDARSALPTLAMAQKAAGVQVGRLLQDLSGVERLAGTGDLNTDLTASGQSLDALRRSLNGRLSIRLANGAVKGVDIERLVREAGATLKGEPAPAATGPLQTEFGQLQASAVVHNGVLSNNDLLATSDYLRITGRGLVDLGGERFSYRFEPMFVKPPEGRAIKELENVPIPVRLTGTFDHPEWSVDLGEALRVVGQRELQKRLDQKGGDAIKRLEERTGIKGLRSLFGR
jgi:AsmA protein